MQEWMLEEWASVKMAYHATGIIFFVSLYCTNNLITIHMENNANLLYKSFAYYMYHSKVRSRKFYVLMLWTKV
jgi:hypothetical protein